MAWENGIHVCVEGVGGGPAHGSGRDATEVASILLCGIDSRADSRINADVVQNKPKAGLRNEFEHSL